MAESILDRYGIKEVCDVTFYEITENGIGAPVLYLDSLKVSTMEQTAENTSARGGKGNAELIMWDYNKEINMTLEDALFSPKSMAIMFGNGTVASTSSTTIKKTVPIAQVSNSSFIIDGKTVPATDIVYCDATGTTSSTSMSNAVYATGQISVVNHSTITITNDTFPGTYYVVGETFARNEKTGEDDYFQLVIPKAKVMPENTITMEADGDPSVFNLNLRVLRPEDGEMVKLIKYDLSTGSTNEE